jgi:hypothetical protein
MYCVVLAKAVMIDRHQIMVNVPMATGTYRKARLLLDV